VVDIIKTLREQAKTQRAELKKTERALAALEPSEKKSTAKRVGRPKGSKTKRGLSEDVQAEIGQRRTARQAAIDAPATV
jgi:hypothetical protein